MKKLFKVLGCVAFSFLVLLTVGCSEKVAPKTFSGVSGLEITLTEEFIQKTDGLSGNISIENDAFEFTASKEMSLENGDMTFTVLKLDFEELPEDIQLVGAQNVSEEWFAEMYTRGMRCNIVNDTENSMVYYTFFGYGYQFVRVIKSNNAFWICEFNSRTFESQAAFIDVCISWTKTIVIK